MQQSSRYIVELLKNDKTLMTRPRDSVIAEVPPRSNLLEKPLAEVELEGRG